MKLLSVELHRFTLKVAGGAIREFPAKDSRQVSALTKLWTYDNILYCAYYEKNHLIMPVFFVLLFVFTITQQLLSINPFVLKHTLS